MEGVTNAAAADGNQTAAAGTENKAEEPAAVNIDDVIDTDFMRGVIGELGLDIKQDELNNLVNEEEKKDEEKKDGDAGDDKKDAAK